MSVTKSHLVERLTRKYSHNRHRYCALMKKTFVFTGLAAFGAVSLHASAYAPDLTTMDASKLWGVSGTLRGFYDDNYNTSTPKQGSAGFEFSPAFTFIMPLQQTELGFRYTYGLYYYQIRENQGSNPIDQTHEADLWIDHAFTERWEGKVQDTFVSAQNPQLSSSPGVLPYRAEGNNINNIGTVTVHTEWSMLFNTDLGYQNNYVAFQQSGSTLASFTTPPTPGVPQGATYAGLMNSIGQQVWLNLNYQYLEDLSFQLGYQFGIVDYTGNEPISQYFFGGHPIPGEFYFSNNRNNYSQYVYVGGNYAATENLNATVQVGFQYVTFDNLPAFDSKQDPNQLQPYADIAVTYTYLPGSYAQIGFQQSENSAATANPDVENGFLTLNQATSVLFASVNHQITPDLLASVIGRYQYSDYLGGAGGAQSWYSLALNLTYSFNQYFSVEAGYNFDYLSAGASLSQYSRNRVYLGVTAAF